MKLSPAKSAFWPTSRTSRWIYRCCPTSGPRIRRTFSRFMHSDPKTAQEIVQFIGKGSELRKSERRKSKMRTSNVKNLSKDHLKVIFLAKFSEFSYSAF